MAPRNRRVLVQRTRYVRAALTGCALAAVVAFGAAGCRADGHPTAAGTSKHGDACESALWAISTYGPPSYQHYISTKETVEKDQLRVLVTLLDAAADADDHPQDKAAIRRTADDYQKFLDDWHGATVPAVTSLLRDSDDLRSLCGS
jgi:hypothetical protein